MGETWRDDLAYLQDCSLNEYCCVCVSDTYLPKIPSDVGTFQDYCAALARCFPPKRCLDACEMHAETALEFTEGYKREFRKLQDAGLLR